MPVLERKDVGPVAHLTLNAPDSLNALSDAMLAALQAQIDALMNDRSIKLVVIGGAGKAFCAGHDLKEMTRGRQAEDGGVAYFRDLFERCAAMMQGLQHLPQPVIARVHGIATAAGCQLVATCDLAVADTDTRFGVNGVTIGLFCSTPMVAFSRNVPRKKAFEMLTSGAFIDADRAVELGLINHAVPPGKLDEAVQELADRITDKIGNAIRIGKRAFYDQIQMPLDQAYARTIDAMVENMMDRDTGEGISAFIEKRPPRWKS